MWRSAIVVLALGVSAAFAADPVLTVQRAGTGSGDVANGGPQISCGGTCTSSFAPGTSVTLTAVALPGSRFTGWLGPCSGTGSCTFAIDNDTTALATFALATAGLPRLDVDGTFACEPSDGLIVLRYLFGLSGAGLNADALTAGALRSSPSALLAYLTDVRPALDIDGNGQADALTDGILILRYLLGLQGDALTANAIGPTALRSTAAQIEPVLATLCSIAVFVEANGSDAAPGTRAEPKQTIAAGLAAAAATDAALVVVGAGTYQQSPALMLLPDLTVLGGYQPGTWTPGGGQTTILGGAGTAPGEGQYMAVLAKNLMAPAALVDVTVAAPSALNGLNSHGIVAIGANLSLGHVTVVGGSGGTGSTGFLGNNASPVTATAAMKGIDGGPAATLIVFCDHTTRGAGGPGGTNNVVAGTSGGAGGPGGPIDTSCNLGSENFNAQSGLNGSNAQTVSSYFGTGGTGAPPNSSTPGGEGNPGLVVNGAGGTGGSSGLVAVGNYVAAKPGSAGTAGTAGGGGGGGGGSGGNDTGTDSYGAGGGGGGAGGAPGSTGGGGAGGGSSIGLYAANSTIWVSESTFVRGIGGNGGPGGTGGQGQEGGAGGAGGLAADDSPAGGAGGAGGHGGHGGGGGGGAGGGSYGIVLRNVQSQIGLTIYTSGSVGGGGPGGPSAPLAVPQDGNDGTSGSAGALAGLFSF